MTQMIVTLEPGADSSLLRKMVENMKGVGSVILKNIHPSHKISTQESHLQKDITDKTEEWIKQMKNLSDSFDSSLIDMDDERTQYILAR